jgi:hypothetical protein
MVVSHCALPVNQAPLSQRNGGAHTISLFVELEAARCLSCASTFYFPPAYSNPIGHVRDIEKTTAKKQNKSEYKARSEAEARRM